MGNCKRNLKSNFYQVITATEKEDLDAIDFPCTVVVWNDTEETRNEAIDLVFKQIKKRYTIYLPSILAIIIWFVLIAISLLSHFWLL